jgi:signal transduction histidine kinase
MEGSKTRSELTVPIKVKGQVIGVLDVQSERLNAFHLSDLPVLQALANQAAIAIENARLYEQAQQLAVIEERQRLARELHDAVTQTLFSASLIAEALPDLWEVDQAEGRQLLRELRQLSRGALAEMRTLLMELRPAALVDANLADLLRQLGEAVTGRTGILVHVSVTVSCTFPPDVHVAFYRIAQEAINNVVKHAAASQVAISLRCPEDTLDDGPRPAAEPAPAPVRSLRGGASTKQSPKRPDVVVLEVRDNGRGFDLANVSPDRLGLGIIRERAQAIGAALHIESQPGRGTQVLVTWKEKRE